MVYKGNAHRFQYAIFCIVRFLVGVARNSVRWKVTHGNEAPQGNAKTRSPNFQTREKQKKRQACKSAECKSAKCKVVHAEQSAKPRPAFFLSFFLSFFLCVSLSFCLLSFWLGTVSTCISSTITNGTRLRKKERKERSCLTHFFVSSALTSNSAHRTQKLKRKLKDAASIA